MQYSAMRGSLGWRYLEIELDKLYVIASYRRAGQAISVIYVIYTQKLLLLYTSMCAAVLYQVFELANPFKQMELDSYNCIC